jgi:hypothetical protein
MGRVAQACRCRGASGRETWPDPALGSDGKVILHQLDAILGIFQGCFALSGCEVIRDQLRALLAGEDSIVFRPQRRGRHGKEGHRLWVLRARAVAHVEYFVHSGTPKTKAQEKVAAAYGWSSSANVRIWGKRAPQILGDEIIAWYMERARQEASAPSELQSFGEAQMREDGANYRRLMEGLEPIGRDKARSTVLTLRSPNRPGVHMELRGPPLSGKTPGRRQS